MSSIPPANERPFGLGYRPDAPDDRDHISHDASDSRLGLYGSAPTQVIPASMMQYRKGLLYQGGAGACVAHALSRTIDMCVRAELVGLGRSNEEPPKASRRYMFFNARQQEVVDAIKARQPVPKMTDHGCFPRLAMRAVQKLGFCDEAFFPYTDDAVKINEAPPPESFKQAFDQSGFKYSRPVVNPVAEVAKGLAILKPTLFGMFVDSDFMRNKGSVIEKIDENDPDGGGHMLAVLEVTPSEVIFDNWWVEEASLDDWGNKGIGRMSHALFASSVVTDRYMIEAAPIFSSRAA